MKVRIAKNFWIKEIFFYPKNKISFFKHESWQYLLFDRKYNTHPYR